MKPSVNILISGGGTGGHIYPAIAIANELKKRHAHAEFLFVGAKDRMEMEKVPQAGYAIEGLWITGIQRKLTLSNLMFPIKLLHSLVKARRIIKRFRPSVVIGTGGFASGPTLQIANQKGIPTLVQEQNSYPGITNKILGKKAEKICVAYDGLERFFPEHKLVKTGNPVRQDLLSIEQNRDEAQQFFKLNPSKKTLLVIGGSLGARTINQLIAKEAAWLLSQDIQVIWQTGAFYIETYQHFDQQDGLIVRKYIQRMDLAYAAADLVISRAGASSISELCLVGKPVLFIPSPNVAEDHQTKNALAVVDKGGALMIEEANLDSFQQVMRDLVANKDKQNSLATHIKALALPKATERIADEIDKILGL